MTFSMDNLPMIRIPELKTGDLVWQQRNPGGACIVLEVVESYTNFAELTQGYCWDDDDFPILRVLHPTEGIIEDPSYYYTSMDLAIRRGWTE